MLTSEKISEARQKAAGILTRAGIVITQEEYDSMEVADLGLGELERTGLEIIVYVNNDTYCAKELVMFPRQTCPEHRHPPLNGRPGKMETFRCRWGRVWLHVPGEQTAPISARMPEGSEVYYTVFHEIELLPGMQYTVPPDTLHWFQAGDEGAVVSEFSTASHDESDVFTNPKTKRIPD